ncbi:MAG: ABC transporter ATP-binding protein [Alphaproteobacteria bacterium]
MTRPIISLNDVHVSLTSDAGSVHILKGVDFNVSAGEAVAVVGPSGSGKSTLLMVIAGLEKTTAGAVRVAGQDLGSLSEDELAVFRRDNVGIVFQAFHLIPTMTALENVAVPLEFAGHRDAFERAEAELAAVGLAHRLRHYPGQLSGGEQQRVALARALAPNPKVLLADEPTGNLDAQTGAEVADLLFKLHEERNATLFLVTHDQTLARRTKRLIRVTDGQVFEEKTPTKSVAIA